MIASNSHRPFQVLVAVLVALASALPVSAADRQTTVIVVRHAEKVDDSRDPALSPAGQARARALSEVLADAGLDAAYASQYRRTRLTAEPAAAAAGVEVTVEPIEGTIDTWAEDFARKLIAHHPTQTVLVVGHSNTVPALVAALCACRVEALSETDYDRIYILNMAEQGAQPRFDLIRARYGIPAPKSRAKPPGEM